MENNKGFFKSNIQMMINNNNYDLDSFYNIQNEKENEILEIKLKQINKATNLTYMISKYLNL